MQGVQWGKLLLNLNNAINALSGLPLRDQLSQRAWRAILAAQIAEALQMTKAAGIAPVDLAVAGARCCRLSCACRIPCFASSPRGC